MITRIITIETGNRKSYLVETADGLITVIDDLKTAKGEFAQSARNFIVDCEYTVRVDVDVINDTCAWIWG